MTDIAASRAFYIDVLGCRQGRSDTRWVDFDFYGHQLSLHLVDQSVEVPTNPVDGEQIPVLHFGVILSWDRWHVLADQLKQKNVSFLVSPTIRFKDAPGEQATMFIVDPNGNAIEFKSFRDPEGLWQT